MSRRAVETRCTVDVAQTAEALHAHVVLEDVEIGPGDTVLIHDAPAAVDYGHRFVCARRATVVRAGLLARTWTRLTGGFALASLFEVGFSVAPLRAAAHRRKA